MAQAVGGDVELWMDGGIRSGQDVLRALAMGAHATMIGRPFLYGLGAMGEAGVARALAIIARELDLTMGFCGLTDLARADTRAVSFCPARSARRSTSCVGRLAGKPLARRLFVQIMQDHDGSWAMFRGCALQ